MALDKIKESVNQLYQYRDRYFETHRIEEACKRRDDVADQLQKTLIVIEENEGEVSEKAQLMLQKGRALNVLPTCSDEAEQLLLSAIKTDPSLFEAWNELGQAAWKREDVQQAKDCFEGALKQTRNKDSLRRLSMALRQQQGSAQERREIVQQSVALAKEAVQLDAADGMSWYVLGNAYLAEFFLCGQDPRSLKQCLSSYAQADKDVVAKANPDLHFNRGSVYRYEEKYTMALESFALAAAYDPEWEEARSKEQELLAYLRQTQELVHTKGKLKEKKLSQMLSQLKESDLGPYAGGKFTTASGKSVPLTQVNIANLIPEETNKEKVVLGKVVSSIASDPFSFCLVDGAGECCAVTVYNQKTGSGVKIGDSVGIPEPYFSRNEVKFNDEELSYNSIRVASPLVLVVNGRKVGRDQVLPIEMHVEVHPE